MRRQLRTPTQVFRNAAGQTPIPRQRRAFLLDTYPASSLQGNPQQVLVSFTDPVIGTRGTTMRASVRAGLSTVAVPVGSPVLIQIIHGRAEVVSVG